MEYVPDPDEADLLPTRIARVRYRFLAAHYRPGTINEYTTGEPIEPELKPLWDAFARAEQRLGRAKKAFATAWERYATAEMALHEPATSAAEPLKRGPKGDTVRQAMMPAVLRLYAGLFGEEPRRADHGPLTRFVDAFLNDLSGPWYWLDAARFEPSRRYERDREHNELLEGVCAPPRRPDAIKRALEGDWQGRTGGWDSGPALLPGYMLRHRQGAQLPLEPAKRPVIRRLAPCQSVR